MYNTKLDQVITNTSFPFDTNIISLQTHQTQGIARREGVDVVKHNWIALMDSDDIALPDRFEKQLTVLEKSPKIDMLGGKIAEFSNSHRNSMEYLAVAMQR